MGVIKEDKDVGSVIIIHILFVKRGNEWKIKLMFKSSLGEMFKKT